MWLQIIRSNRCLKTLSPAHFNSLENAPALFKREQNNLLTTWSVLRNYNRSGDNVSSLTSEENAAATTRTNVLIEKGLTEEKKSKAMKAYLDRAQKYNAFMTQQRDEYHNGKRHLANMMGADPETFTQEDVDSAIEYLFPSGLFVPSARPFMKPPEKVFPPKKDAEFDDSGRPFHFLFYTGKPNFYQLLHDFGQHLVDLNDYEDRMISKNLQPDPNVHIELSGSIWIKKEDLELKLVEVISDREILFDKSMREGRLPDVWKSAFIIPVFKSGLKNDVCNYRPISIMSAIPKLLEYDNLIRLLERVRSHPYVYNIKDAVMAMRVPLTDVKMDFSKPPEPSYDDQGRAYITTEACPRKSARATVTVWYPGTGKIDINGSDISYFDHVQPREQILFPLHFSGMLNKVDIEATVTGGGTSGQAGAVRWGIAWGLRSFLKPDAIEKMRLAGLLTRDFRHRERKKPGQWKARRKYTWKKR